jgi:phage tail sheath protein FI
MPVTPTYPGVYVQEVPSGVRTITGVGTSIGMFLGQASNGPIGTPVLCTGWLDFVRVFSEDTTIGTLPHYVRLFFLNGGTSCWVVRLANGAAASSVVLANEAAVPVDVLELTAKSQGLVGETIRAIVSYSGAQPEATFTIELFRWDLVNNRRVPVAGEVWPNLTMDPNAPTYAPDFLTQNSKLVSAAEAAGAPAPANGSSTSGRPVAHSGATGGNNASFKTAFGGLFGTTVATGNHFMISVDGSPFVDVDLSAIDIAAMAAGTVRSNLLPAAIKKAVEDGLNAKNIVGVTVTASFEAGPPSGANATSLLRIRSNAAGDVFIKPAGNDDSTAKLMLGTTAGGIEIGAHAARRPAPNGITLDVTNTASLNTVRGLTQADIASIVLDTIDDKGVLAPKAVTVDLKTTAGTDPIFVDNLSATNGNSDGLREKLGILAAAINAEAATSPVSPLYPWTAEVHGSRLSIRPTGAAGNDNFVSVALATAATDIEPQLKNNVAVYTLGAGGLGIGAQTAGTTGNDGAKPLDIDYDAAYAEIDREVDLFNIMVLSPDAAGPVQDLYGKASVFCQQRRAVLLMDPPAGWTDLQAAIDPATGVSKLRIGLVSDTAALYFPNLVIREKGRDLPTGPAGAMAGVLARTDATRGVWKSPAGTDADIRGAVGLQRRFSDQEHGFLNPRGINTLRIFPDGLVSFGARTMDGDDAFASEWKYLAIRRTAYFIEESLYRGLKWVVFEPNDEPLWAQIRLNVGAFMHDLFRKGAFEGPKDLAYFEKCDGETTTPTDRNLGVVNIHVGFAPLKPAEFVILYLRQQSAPIET